MSQATISRRRPCRQCGGRYFVGTFSIMSVLLALIAALGGIAKAVIGSGLFTVIDSGRIPALYSVVSHASWAIGGIVIAAIVLAIGHGYRCIACDTQQ